MLKQQIQQFTTKFVKDKNIRKKECVEEMEQKIFKLNTQLPRLSGLQYDNVKQQISMTIEQFLVVHKVDW